MSKIKLSNRERIFALVILIALGFGYKSMIVKKQKLKMTNIKTQTTQAKVQIAAIEK